MNSIEARRRLLADPRNLDPGLEALLREDSELAAWREKLLSLDNEVADALGEVVPPKGLAERIILRTRYRHRSRWSFAIAATLVLATLLIAVEMATRPDPIAEAMIDHVIQMPDELADDGNVAPDHVRTSLAAIGVTFRDAGYKIRHLKECDVAGIIGRHLVVSTPEGLVSLLVLPTRGGESANRRTISKGGFYAVVLPQPGAAIGAIASEGMRTERLDSLMRQMFVLQS